MPQYRKKPVVIEAEQLTEFHTPSCLNFGYPKAEGDTTPHPLDGKHWIGTLEGDMVANVGDWIITGVKGEQYPCKPDIFEATYEPVATA